MLTSFWVQCPHSGCGWAGSLLPCSNADAWRGTTPSGLVVDFRCPKCQAHWRARIEGEDIVLLPWEEPILS
jgi:hypothetical protein